MALNPSWKSRRKDIRVSGAKALFPFTTGYAVNARRRWSRACLKIHSRPKAVSYTHLDVYKRQVYDLIYMMVDQTNPALTSAQSLMYLFYRESFVAGNRGYASAIVIWTVALIGIITALQFWGQKKWVTYMQ